MRKIFIISSFLFLSSYSNSWSNNLPCFQKTGEGVYESVSAIFNLKDDLKIFEEPQCREDQSERSFMGKFGIIKEGYLKENGDTIVTQINIINFHKALSKKDYNSLIRNVAQSLINEGTLNKNPRFQYLNHSSNKIKTNDNFICQNVAMNIKDISAPNMPSFTNHLIQKDLYYFCYIKSNKTLFSVGVSARVNPKVEKGNVDLAIKNKLNEIIQRIILRDGILMPPIL